MRREALPVEEVASRWSLNKPEVSVVTNVIQNAAPRRSPEEVKAHLVELQRAVWAECDRLERLENEQKSSLTE